jgi:hypothetical protein
MCLVVSCANVTFHSDPELKKETGLKYYTAKPYLLIGPTGNKDAPMKAEIISLPDLENPTYAKYHPGWGSHQFSLAVFSNGNLSSYGQTADSKIPETIAALSGLATTAATMGAAPGAAAGAATVKSGAAPAPGAKSAPLWASGGGGKARAKKFTVKDYVDAAIDQLSQITQMVSDQDQLVISNKETAKKLIETFPKPPLVQPDLEATLSLISDAISNAVIADASHVEAAVAINSFYSNAKKNVDSAIALIQARKPAKQDFKLFEIQMKDGKTCLIPADCELASEAIRHWGYSK